MGHAGIKRLFTVLALVPFLCTNTYAGDYTLAPNSNIPQIEERCLPLLESLVPPQKHPAPPPYLSEYHPLTIVNRIKGFGRYIPLFGYQQGRGYPKKLIELEQAVTVCAAGWEGAVSGEYGTLAAPAGMPAINMMVDAALEKKGLGTDSEIIVIEPPYGCTKNLFESWGRRGVKVHSVSVNDVKDKLPGLINDKTAIIYGESLANPNLMELDVESVLRINRRRAAVLIDDTFATPEMIRSLQVYADTGGGKYSVDMVMTGLTKGTTGTGNIISGAVTAKREWLDILAEHRNSLPEAKEVERAIRGIRYLEIRFKAQSENARKLAGFLRGRTRLIKDVVYPGNGHMIYYVFKKVKYAVANINLLSKFRTLINAVSLGQIRNLFERPSGGTHITVNEEAQRAGEISPAGVRGSAGIEDIKSVEREMRVLLDIIDVYGGRIPQQDLKDLNKVFMAEYVTQDGAKRTGRYLVPKWPVLMDGFYSAISELLSDIPVKERNRLIQKYDTNKKFRTAVNRIAEAVDIRRYDPVTIAIHHRLIWCLLSGDHTSVIASPVESTTSHKESDAHMQETFASILQGTKTGFPPLGNFSLYSRLGRPGTATVELLAVMLETGIESALSYEYIGTSFYTEQMAQKAFLEQESEILIAGAAPEEKKEIIVVTPAESILCKTVRHIIQNKKVRIRLVTPDSGRDIKGILEKEINKDTAVVYFDNMRLEGYNPEEIRDTVKKANPNCRFGITDSFNLGYGGPRQDRNFDFIMQVIYYEDTDYGAVLISRNDRDLSEVQNNPFWTRKNRGTAMSDDNAAAVLWYVFPYLKVFDRRYEDNIDAAMDTFSGTADNMRRVGKRDIEIIFRNPEDKALFLRRAEDTGIIGVREKEREDYFFINEWTHIRNAPGGDNAVILRAGIENTEDLRRAFEDAAGMSGGAIGTGAALREKGNVPLSALTDEQRNSAGDAIDRIRDYVLEAELTEEERQRAEAVIRFLTEYFKEGSIYAFFAPVNSPEDYLLAFAHNGRIALSRDFLDPGYVIREFHFQRLPEILFHEGLAAMYGERDYEEHKKVYSGIQRKIFGRENHLEDELRLYINLKLPAAYGIEFDKKTQNDQKINLSRITALLRDKDFIYETIRRIYGCDTYMLSLANIARISVVHGGTGSQKQTLRVTVTGRNTHFEFALKTAINKAARNGFAKSKNGKYDEIPALRRLSAFGGNVRIPKFGVYIEEPDNNFYAYSEEWIEGPTGHRIMAKKDLTPARLKDIVFAYLSVMKSIGVKSKKGSYLGIRDTQAQNVISNSKNYGESVVVDLGKIDFINPLFILSEFDRHYSKGRGRLLEAVFDGVIGTLGREEGIAFLGEALNRTRINKNPAALGELKEALERYILRIYITAVSHKAAVYTGDTAILLLNSLSAEDDNTAEEDLRRKIFDVMPEELRSIYENDTSLSNELKLKAAQVVLNTLSARDTSISGIFNMSPGLDKVCALLHISFLLSHVTEKNIAYAESPEGETIIDLKKAVQIRKGSLWGNVTYKGEEINNFLHFDNNDTYLALGGGAGKYNVDALLSGVKKSIYIDVFADNCRRIKEIMAYFDVIKSDDAARLRREVFAHPLPGDYLRERYGARSEYTGGLMDIIQADAAHIPLQDNSVAKLSILHLFRYIKEQGGEGNVIRVIREALRVTAPGGLILFAPDSGSREMDYYIELFSTIASAMEMYICVKETARSGEIVFKIVSKAMNKQDILDALGGADTKITAADLERVKHAYESSGSLGPAQDRIARQIGFYGRLKERIPENGKVTKKNILIDKDALPENQRYILEGEEWMRRKRALERMFPGYTFSIFRGQLEEEMNEQNTIVILGTDKRDREINAGTVFVQNTDGNSLFPIDGLMFLGAGLLALSEDDREGSPLVSVLGNIYREIAGQSQDIRVFLDNHTLDIVLPPVERFSPQLNQYAVSLLEQAA